MTVTNKPGHRGEREGNRKTIARGMPGVSGVTVVTNSCAFYFAHEAAGASGARHSLRPLYSEGTGSCITRAFRAAGMRSCVSIVMPRFKRGIQYAVASHISRNRLWNTGSPGQTGRRHLSMLFEI